MATPISWPFGYAAITFNCLCIILPIFVWFIGFFYYKYKRKKFLQQIPSHNQQQKDYLFPVLFYRIFPCGVDKLFIDHLTENIQISHERWCCCCCLNRKRTISFSDLIDVKIARCPFTIWTVLNAIIVGCLVGMFIHFIPCFGIWACDAGPQDRFQTRGIMWFSSWAACTLLLIIIPVRFQFII